MWWNFLFCVLYLANTKVHYNSVSVGLNLWTSETGATGELILWCYIACHRQIQHAHKILFCSNSFLKQGLLWFRQLLVFLLLIDVYFLASLFDTRQCRESQDVWEERGAHGMQQSTLAGNKPGILWFCHFCKWKGSALQVHKSNRWQWDIKDVVLSGDKLEELAVTKAAGIIRDRPRNCGKSSKKTVKKGN